MRKIAALKIDYTYMEAPDSEARLDRFYSWLINKAIDNLTQGEKGIDNNSTQKYTENNGRSGDISNPRGSGQGTQTQKDHNLQNVQSRQASSSKIWQGLENQQQETRSSIGGKI
jgi:hypothetical protein